MRKNESAESVNLNSVLKGALFGTAVSLFIAAVASFMISRGLIKEDIMKTAAFIAAYLGALFGSSSATSRGKPAVSAAVVSGILILIRYVVAAFGGEKVFSAMSLIVTAAILLGGLTTLLAVARRRKRRRSARR